MVNLKDIGQDNNSNSNKINKVELIINKLLTKEIKFKKRGLSNRKKFTLYSDLHVLLSSGIDIKTTFDLILENFKNKEEIKTFSEIRMDIINGESITNAFLKSKLFSMYEIYSIKIGEETGKLNLILKELSLYFMKKMDQKRSLISAFSYPIIVMVTAIGAIIFMMMFIVPMFEDVFKRFGNKLPPLTQFIINFSENFDKVFFALVIVLSIILVIIYFNRKSEFYRKYSSLVLIKLPIFGDLIRKIYISRFCLGMELLLSSKTPILNTIQLIQKMISFYPIESSLQKIENDLLHGSSLSESMKHFEVYDKRMISMIKVAEEVNQLEKIFNQLKDQYNSEIDFLSKNINSVMEPLLIIFIGSFVGIILIAMYLPMFQLSSGISF
jgi:type IV pilus assembly protein PilC